MNILSIGNNPLSIGYSIISMADYIPVALPATYVSNTYFNLNWEKVNYASSYVIDVATDIGFTNKIVNNLTIVDTPIMINYPNSPSQYDSGLRTYEITGLTQSTTYYYRLRSVINSTTSRNSNVITTTTTIYTNKVEYLLVGSGNGSMGIGAGGGWGGYVLTGTSYRVDVENEHMVLISGGGYGNEGPWPDNTIFSSLMVGFVPGRQYGDVYNTTIWDYYGESSNLLYHTNGADGDFGINGAGYINPTTNYIGRTGYIGGSGYTFGTFNTTYQTYNGNGGGGGSNAGNGNNAGPGGSGTGAGSTTIIFDGTSKTYGRGGNGTTGYITGSNGTVNTGNGSGGSGIFNGSPTYTFDNRIGGSGIVRVKYLTGSLPTMTGGTKTTYGSYTIHTFTSSGVFKKQ